MKMISNKRKPQICGEIIGLMYPQKCISCGAIVDETAWLCKDCLREIKTVRAQERCLSCGLERRMCCCQPTDYRYSAVIAPFLNDGEAKAAFYHFKFHHRRHYAQFFARCMADCVRDEYAAVRFDAVCCVPTTLRHGLQRGYNPAEVLARAVAKRLSLPFAEDALRLRPGKKTLHRLSYRERFSAVRDAFTGGEFNPKGKNLLLTDDIRTTGATLDACARQLLRSGAKSVYCVTALVTPPTVTRKSTIPANAGERKDQQNGNRNRN